MSEKILFLHCGIYKTGSSALQFFLKDNSDYIATFGIGYPVLSSANDSYLSCNGNGSSIYSYIKLKDEYRIRTILNDSFGDFSRIIISNEDLSNLDIEDLCYFKAILDDLNISIKVIVFYRSVFNYLLSAYSEKVKHGILKAYSETNLINAIASGSIKYGSNFLNCCISVFGIENICVKNYDLDKSKLCSQFLNTIGLQGDDLNFKHSSLPINRSLGIFEQSLVEHFVNEITAGKKPTIFQELLVYNLSKAIATSNRRFVEKVIPSDGLLVKLREMYAEEIDKINIHLPNGNQVNFYFESVKLSNVEPYDYFDLFKNIVLFFAQQLSSGGMADENDFLYKFVNKVEGLLKVSQSESYIVPNDFDAVAYLIKNPDLVTAGVNPYEHYELFGKVENRIHVWNKS